jgi:hypothetical protein
MRCSGSPSRHGHPHGRLGLVHKRRCAVCFLSARPARSPAAGRAEAIETRADSAPFDSHSDATSINGDHTSDPSGFHSPPSNRGAQTDDGGKTPGWYAHSAPHGHEANTRPDEHPGGDDAGCGPQSDPSRERLDIAFPPR